MEALRNETEHMMQELAKLSSPLVFCHNDLQSRNIIYNEKNGNHLI